MTIKSSGSSLNMNEITAESYGSSGATASLNDKKQRALALKMNPSTTISFGDFYGKTHNYREFLWRNTTCSTTSPSPVENYYRRCVFKWYINYTELQDHGWTDSYHNIYELTFNVTSAPTYQPLPEYRIYMQNTGSGSGTDLTSNWTQVYYRANQSIGTGEVIFPLDSSFRAADGSNLAICVAFGQCPTTWSTTGAMYVNSIDSSYVSNYNWTDAAGTYYATDAAPSTVGYRPSSRLRKTPNSYIPIAGNNGYNTTTSPSPNNNWYRRILFKSIYTADEIKAAIGFPTYYPTSFYIKISRIGLSVGGAVTSSNQPYPNWQFSLANTSSSPGTDVTSGWTTPINQSQSFTTTGDYVWSVNDFQWYTGQNLALCWCWGQSPNGYSQSGQTLMGTGTSNYNWTDAAGTWYPTDSAPSTVSYRPYVVFYSNSKIICAKLHDLGLLPDDIYKADQEFGENLIKQDPLAALGYLTWANHVVEWMEGRGPTAMFWIRDLEQRSKAQKEWAIRWAKEIATPWAEELSRVMGYQETSPLAGKALRVVGLPICRAIGGFIKNFGQNKTEIKPAGLGTSAAIISVLALMKCMVNVCNLIDKVKK